MDCRRAEGGRFKCKWALIDHTVGSEPKTRQNPHVGPPPPSPSFDFSTRAQQLVTFKHAPLMNGVVAGGARMEA